MVVMKLQMELPVVLIDICGTLTKRPRDEGVSLSETSDEYVQSIAVVDEGRSSRGIMLNEP